MGVLDPTSSTVCQICGIPGHNALQCNNHFNHGFIANDLPKSFVAMSVGESKMLPALDQILHQTSSKGDVYPLSPWSISSSPQANVALHQPGDIWHRQLDHSGAPSYIVYTINRLPAPILHGISPYEKLFHRSLDCNFLRVFGCASFSNLSAQASYKIAPRSVSYFFLGYASEYKGHRCLNPIYGRVYVSRHATLHEYLLGTLTYGLSLRTSSSASMVIAYSDADCDGCPDNRRSTTGSAIFLGHNLIAWRAKKQPTGLLHTLLAETCWIHHILCELGVFIRDPIRVLCDNVSSKYMTRNPVHDHSKHIDVNFHFVRDKLSVTAARPN
uniref:Retroviral polymerase SH3-like domain-containing protein n=1 Tax=Solanum lycopersicum TaxID=4081 RepID=A0A3Q7H9B9_SOLLC